MHCISVLCRDRQNGPGPAGTGTGTGTKFSFSPGPGPGLICFSAGPGMFFLLRTGLYIFLFLMHFFY